MREVIMGLGGRRFLGDDVDYLQQNVKELTSALAEFCQSEGDSNKAYVLSGVRFSGDASPITATNGWIHYKGEVYRFYSPDGGIAVSGLSNLKLYIDHSDDLLLNYEDNGTPVPIQVNRFITYNTVDYVDNPANEILAENKILISDVRRARKHCAGEIIAFSPRGNKPFSYYCDLSTGLGINGMEGKALCDGRNGTPDLQGRFIVGLSTDGLTVDNVKTPTEYDGIGKNGGERLHKLVVNNIPKHKHGGATGESNTDLNHNHNENIAGVSSTNSGPGIYLGVSDIGGSHWGLNNSVGGTGFVNGAALSNMNLHVHNIAEEGGGGYHENRPPYYVLAYFQKIGDEDVLIGTINP